MRNLVIRFLDLYLKHYIVSALVAIVVFVVTLTLALRIDIDSDQLNLIPGHLPQVKEVRKITKMIGGTGIFTICLYHKEKDEGDKLVEQSRWNRLKGNDQLSAEQFKQAGKIYKRDRKANDKKADALRKASDILYKDLMATGDVRYIQYKLKLDFLKSRVLYRLEPPDLKEAFRRVSIKRDELIEKADPFYIELENKNYKLDLSDIIEKYSKIGKREVVDEYYVSSDRRMMVMFLKPNFPVSNAMASKEFLAKVKNLVAKSGIDKLGVEAGYTGGYVEYVDIYNSIKNSLIPATAMALVGIAIILFFFVRRFFLIGAMLVSLVYALVLIFGITYIVIGDLNLITSLLAGVMAGLGIDFGIHFIFRFREAMSKLHDMYASIREAILTTGSAAVWSASTTSVAFVMLIISDFRGFSEFGLISAYGLLIMVFAMFLLTPLQLVIMSKISPRFNDYLRKSSKEVKDEAEQERQDAEKLSRFNLTLTARFVMIFFAVIVIPLGYYSTQIKFDYDSRRMLESDVPSELLNEEINLRYELSSNPLVIAHDNLEEAAAVFDHLDPLEGDLKDRLDQVFSLFAFIPPLEMQLKNYKEIQKFKRATSVVKYGMVPGPYKPYWGMYKKIINARPFIARKNEAMPEFDEVPEFIRWQFKSVKSSPIQGWLTYLYPTVNKLYDANDLKSLDKLVGRMEYPLVTKRNLRMLASHVEKYEKKTKKRFKNSPRKKGEKPELIEVVHNVKLTEREAKGVLDMLNNLSAEELGKLNFFPGAIKIVTGGRPFEKIADVQKEKKVAVTTGSTLLIANLVYILEREIWYIVLGTVLLVAVLLYFTFRNLGNCIIAFIPLITGMILMFGVMALVDVRINYFNLAVLPIIIGYGINNSIFILRRYLEKVEMTGAVFRTTSAVLASSLTTLVGWGSLSIAQHPGLRSMGFVACIGMGIMMIVSITLLPAILQKLSDTRQANKSDAPGELKDVGIQDPA